MESELAGFPLAGFPLALGVSLQLGAGDSPAGTPPLCGGISQSLARPCFLDMKFGMALAF